MTSLGPLVSVLINNFNYGRFLRQAIDSAVSQSYTKIEVIVVDDGSTDNSREVIRSFGDRVVSVFKENGGQASAFNSGFAISKGEWICLLDADDFFEQDKIKILVESAADNQSAGILAHNLAHCDAAGNAVRNGIGSVSKTQQLVDDRQATRRGRLNVFLPATSALAIRRDILSQLLPMPEDIIIIADNYLKIAALSLAPALLIPMDLATQRIHGGNLYTTLRPKTDDAKVKQCLISASIIFHLKSNFPYLSRVAWKEYGHILALLNTSHSPDAKAVLEKIRSNYNPLERSAACYFYVARSFVKNLIRKRPDSSPDNSLAGDPLWVG